MSNAYLGIGSRISHPKYGKGVVIQINAMTYTVMFIEEGEVQLKKDDAEMKLIERVDPDEDGVSLWDVEQMLVRVLRKWADPNELVHLGDKWIGGTILLQPKDPGLKAKEMPIDGFFHKIVMLRDRLRVLEQRINAHNRLTDEDKVNMQQYITRIYGSLTSFNLLFKHKDDYFVGDKSEG
jgi:hypothetical protein